MAESSRARSERRSSRGYGYGSFKIKASEKLSATNAKKLAILFELTPAEMESIMKAESPGLSLIEKLEEMSIISNEKIDELVDAMGEINLQASASELRKEFSKVKKDPGVNVSKQTSPSLRAETYSYLTMEQFENNVEKGIDTLNVINSFKKDEYERRIINYSLRCHRKLELSSYDSGSLHIAILGKTGDGKSSTANTIIGRESFKTSQSSNSLTKFSSDETCTFRNRNITVVDTPGIHDTELDHSAIKREIIRWAFLLRGGVHCFIICMNASDPRFKNETQEMLELIKPSEDGGFYNHCMLVYTKAESALNHCSLDHFLERKKENEFYKMFIDAIDGRVVAVNNTTKIPAEQQRNREAILAMAEKIVKENKDRGLKELYTNEIIERAERLHNKIATVVAKNQCHPILVNAAVESFIYFSDETKVPDVFKENVLKILMKRQQCELEDNTKALIFNYDGRRVVIVRDIYEKHIQLIFNEMKTAFMSFMDLLRKLPLPLTLKVTAAITYSLFHKEQV